MADSSSEELSFVFDYFMIFDVMLAGIGYIIFILIFLILLIL